MNSTFWAEYREVFELLRHDGDSRAIVVSGNGKYFTVGLDIKDPTVFGGSDKDADEDNPKDVARKY